MTSRSALHPGLSPDHRGTSRHSRAKHLVIPARQIDANTLPKVALENLSLSYKVNDGSQLLALDNIQLKVNPGEFLCIVGPSGCGKSTLLHLIAGLQKATSGNVRMDGRLVDAPGTDRILIFQELGLFPWLTVAQNVEFGMKMKGMRGLRASGKNRILSSPRTSIPI